MEDGGLEGHESCNLVRRHHQNPDITQHLHSAALAIHKSEKSNHFHAYYREMVVQRLIGGIAKAASKHLVVIVHTAIAESMGAQLTSITARNGNNVTKLSMLQRKPWGAFLTELSTRFLNHSKIEHHRRPVSVKISQPSHTSQQLSVPNARHTT